MISSSTPAIAWPPPSTRLYGLPSGISPPAVSGVASSTFTMSPSRGCSSTGAQVAFWSRSVSSCSATVLVGDRRLGARDPEPFRARELELRAHLEVQLEGERLALLELHVVHVRLRGDLQLLALHHFLERLLHQRLEDLLADGVLEPLAHHRRRRLAGPEARAAAPSAA